MNTSLPASITAGYDSRLPPLGSPPLPLNYIDGDSFLVVWSRRNRFSANLQVAKIGIFLRPSDIPSAGDRREAENRIRSANSVAASAVYYLLVEVTNA